MKEISSQVKEYILREFLPGENPEKLTESTPLITGGILDSIAIIKLVAFLEERYGIVLALQEVDVKNLGTVSNITNLVYTKLGATSASDCTLLAHALTIRERGSISESRLFGESVSPA